MWKWRGRGNPKKQDFTPPLGKASQKTCSAFPHFHKPGDIYFPIQRRRKLASHLTEVIHFGNDFISSVASLRSLDAFHWNRWRLSIGITGGIRRNTHKMRKALKSACENAKVPHCTHHSLRHAYATILHEKGKDIGTISKLLGHANPTITQNIYVHWRDEHVHQAALDVVVGEAKVLKKCKIQKMAR